LETAASLPHDPLQELPEEEKDRLETARIYVAWHMGEGTPTFSLICWR
jgi:hypothetical protein